MSHRTVLRFLLSIVLLACTSWHGAAQPLPDVSFRIAARDPSGRATLARRQPLYLRIEYESNVPVRFRASTYRGGEPIDGAAHNPAPPYPEGRGEGLAWIAFDEAVQIDEVRVTALDERWQEIATVRQSMDVAWSGMRAPGAHAPTPWARRLSDEQQNMSAAAAKADGNEGGGGGLSLMALSIPGYLLLQSYMLLRLRNGWRWAAMVPLVGMVPLGLFTLLGLLAGASLWPLAALLLTPIALGYLVVLGAITSLAGGGAEPLAHRAD